MHKILSVPGVWAGWVAFRLLLGYFILQNHSARGDIAYYFYGIFGDDPTMMTEYPHAGVWPTLILGWIVGDRIDAYYIAFTVMMLLIDALFLAFLLRHHDGRSQVFLAGWFWVLFGTAAGHVFVWRLDLFPGVAVAAAAALLATRPHWAAACLAFATTMKLWPGVLAAGLVGRFNHRGTWTRLAAFFGTLVALCLFTVATSGFDRLISPLTYQDDRGLQVESIPATIAMLQGHHDPASFDVSYAASKSFEITGPGVEFAQQISSVAMVVAIVFALAWAIGHFVMGGWNPRKTMVFFITIILLLLVANKVFSPQYIVWLGPVLAVFLRQEGRNTFAWILSVLCVIAAALGTYVFPFNYEGIMNLADLAPAYALAARNGIIVVMAVLSVVWLVRETLVFKKFRQRGRPAESENTYQRAQA